jgi:hypothetical protein
MKNVATRSQNVRDCIPSSSASMAGRNGRGDRSGTGTGSVAPYGSRPTDCGRSRTKIATIGKTRSIATAATVSAA